VSAVFSLSCAAFLLLTATILTRILRPGTPEIPSQLAWTLSPVLIVLIVALMFQAG
jgi:hypothetical protein